MAVGQCGAVQLLGRIEFASPRKYSPMTKTVFPHHKIPHEKFILTSSTVWKTGIGFVNFKSPTRHFNLSMLELQSIARAIILE